MHAGPDSVLVAVAGEAAHPAVVGRWNLCLVDRAGSPELDQPYHAAAEVLGVEAGRERIARCEEAARVSADRIVETVIGELASAGVEVSAAGMVMGAGRLAATLEQVLRSHVQLHTAEGEMLRTALGDAAEARGLAVVRVAERELSKRVAALTGLAETGVGEHVAAVGLQLGPPWTRRQQQACLVGWAALAGLG
jgi:hypothetical protein